MFTDDDWVEVRGWSPDGKSFMAVNEPDEGGPQLLRIPVDGGQPHLVRTLTSWPGLVDFTPDGRSLIYDRAVEVDDENRDIYLLDLVAEREYAIIQSPANDQLLGWIPGSSNILFSSDRSGTTGVWSQHVENGRAEGAPVLVKPDFWRAKPIGFTKDGTFYYSVQSSGPNVWTATMDMATGAVGEAEPIPLPWPISGNRLLFGWSSDGRALSVLLNTELTVRSLATGESRTYTSLPRYYPMGPMRWSADGSAIFWRARVAFDPVLGATFGLLRFDLGTGQARVFDVPVREREEFNGFDLLPDGNSAVVRRRTAPEFTTDRQSLVRLSLLDLKTGAERELFELRGSTLGFAVSPDGSRVAVSQLAPADRGPGGTPRASSEFFVIPLSGAPEPRKVATGPVRGPGGGLSWEPSGEALIHVTNEETQAPGSGPLVRYADRFALDGSPLQTIRLTIPERARGLGVLSPTANRLAFRAGEEAYELWALEGLPGSASAPRPR
jgi:Tol biopolymer transport system component